MLTMTDIQRAAPSVFAREAYEKTSDKYQFFPTDYVVQALMNNGFRCSAAGQAKTRIEGKKEFTRHVLRFRHDDMPRIKDEGIPEVVLVNSHDGSSSYRLMLGVFRIACANGLIVASSMMEDIRVRHSGRDNLIDNVIEGSFKVIGEAPKAIEQVNEWQGLMLPHAEQRLLAEAALELRGTSLEIGADTLLRARRPDDREEGGAERSLWKTMNVVQENLIKGGIYGTSPVRIEDGRQVGGQLRKLTKLKSVVEDTKFNRALWKMTEGMAELKTKAAA